MTKPPAPPANHAEVFARLSQLKQLANENTVGQHAVSRVVLKGFAGPDGRLREVSVRYPNAKSVLKGTKGAGKVPNLVPVASTSAEALWKQVEDRLPPVLDMCERDALLEDRAAMDLVLDTIALHYIRSNQTPQVHALAYRRARAATAQRAVSLPSFELELKRRYGPNAGWREAAELLHEGFAEHDQDFGSGLMLREAFERLFEKARAWLSGREIEIIHPATGSFLIGDNPAVTVGRDGRLGSIAGVALGDAVYIIMPISRTTLVSIGPTSQVGTVPESVVRHLNSCQVRLATDYVYVHPDDDLVDFVRRVRFASRA